MIDDVDVHWEEEGDSLFEWATRGIESAALDLDRFAACWCQACVWFFLNVFAIAVQCSQPHHPPFS